MSKNISQEALGLEVGYSRSGIYQLESGNQSCPSNIQWAIKKALGVENIPFTEPERESFRDKLYFLYDLISNNKLDEAKEEWDKLSVITHLPCDKELNALYNLFQVRSLLKQNDVETARTILADLQSSMSEFDNELKHLYYINIGTLCCRDKKYKDGLDSYLKARELMTGGFEENQWLFYNIAYCLSKLGYVFSTITFIEDNCNLRSNGQTTLPSFAMEHLLAKNYLKTNHIRKAKKLFTNCLEKARNEDDELLIGLVLVDFSNLYRKCQDWGTALDYIDNAFCYLQKGSTHYLEAFYQKILCHIEMGNFPLSEALLKEGKELAQNNKIYSILFESLGHLITLNEDKSMKYLEKVAITYFLGAYAKDTALDYCNILQEQYAKRGTLKKQLYVEKIIAGIYKDMLEGGLI